MKTKTARHIEQGAVDYLLTGKAFCGHCGAAMIGDSGTSRTGDRHYYYSCQAHKARKGCGKKSVGKQYLEDAVINFILDNVLQEPEINRIADAVTKAQAEAVKSSPLAALKSDLAEVKKKIANVNGAIAQGIYTSSTLDMLRDLEAESADIQKSIDFVSFCESQLIDHDRVIFFLHHATNGDRSDPAFRKYIINTFVNAVYLFDDHFKLVINNVDGNLRYPLEDLSDGSDSESFGPPNTTYPNHRITIYVIPVEPDKKRA